MGINKAARLTDNDEVMESTEPPEEEMFDQWLEELGEVANDIVDAMSTAFTDKLNAYGMGPNYVLYVSEVLFSGVSGHEVWETIWNALMRM